MRLFVSAGEPSGDLHGANLIRALRAKDPSLQVMAFGGNHMAAEGANLIAHCDSMEAMGLGAVLTRLPQFISWVSDARRQMRKWRPDAVVLIDFPGFNWWIAAKAKELGIPVIFFVPPQIWAWASWRVSKMRRLVDRVLCNFPFEESWYKARGVNARLVGHPYFDELNQRILRNDHLQKLANGPGRMIAILPGTRKQELEYNGKSLLKAAANIHSAYPDVRFEVACLRPGHAQKMAEMGRSLQLPHTMQIRFQVDSTPEIISQAWACMAVSGSVSLELLHQAIPTQIIYRSSRPLILFARTMKTCKYISLPNLLADEELFPEMVEYREVADDLACRMGEWLLTKDNLEPLRKRLRSTWTGVFRPGACNRASDEILDLVACRTPKPASWDAG